MKPKLLAGISILIVVILAVLFVRSHHNSQKHDIYSQLQALPGFDRLKVEGRYFLLHFWAKWCAPCAEEIPHLVAFANTAQENLKALPVLAVSLDETLEQSKTILPNRGEGLPSNFLLLLDAEHSVAEGLGSFQYPETYFYDSKGHLLQKWVGPQKWDSPEVLEYFRQKVLTNP